MRRLVAVAIVLAVAASSCGGDSERVVVAAGTTLVDSGFLDLVIDSYVEDTGAERPSVVGRSSLEAIALGSSGDADVLLTHEPDALAGFLADHSEAVVTEPFASRFVIVGPPDLGIDGVDAPAVFTAVPDAGVAFVSRDDGSGTHARERSIWDAAGIVPDEQDWYVRAGAGMGATLLIASDRGGVTLSELGAFLSAAPTVDLVEIELGDTTGLGNPYQLTVVDPAASGGASELQVWLASDTGRDAIDRVNHELFGFVVYEVP